MDTALTRHRLFLLIGAVAIPLLGVLRLIVKPGFPDPMWLRAVLTALFAAALAASYRFDWARERLHEITLILCHIVLIWLISYVSARGGLDHDMAIGVVMCTAAMMAIVTHWYEVFSFLAVLALTIFHASMVGPPDSFSGPVLFVMATTVVLAGGGGSVARSRLEQLLKDANEGLERRVVARTTELQAEVKQRTEAEHAAEQASRAKSTFLATMSHELRTPLNAVIGYTEMVQDELEAEQVELLDDLGHALGSARHLLGIIDDVLDLSRIESGLLGLEINEVGLDSIVREALQVVEPLARDRDNTLVFEGTSLRIRTDRGRVRQILVALLENSARFTTSGRISVAVEPSAEGISLLVADTGRGIPEAEVERVFDRFYQVDGSATREHGGTGLGLALCRELTERLGGKLEVQSLVAEGSTFTLSLPAAIGSMQRM